MDTIVIDIETKNTFFDVGKDNLDALEVSMIGVYSYATQNFISFDENQIEEATEFIKKADLIIGFSINRFDIPVLSRHLNFDLFAIARFDLLDEIEKQLGWRISLNKLAITNLGVKKTHHGLEAPLLYRRGQIEELKNYCLYDVKITKDLYELVQNQGYLSVPCKDNRNELAKFVLNQGHTTSDLF